MPYALMSSTAVIRRAVKTKDSSGAPAETFRTVAWNVPCRVRDDSSGEGIRYMRESSRLACKVYLSGAVDVKAGDRIFVDNRILDVQGVRRTADETGLGTLVADAEETL